ncbi:MAG: hypothetical protein ABFD75_12140 [Smithella sp.]
MFNWQDKYSPLTRVGIAIAVFVVGVINTGFAVYGFVKWMGWIS